jgi:nitroreductase
MVRAYHEGVPVAPDVLARLLAQAQRAPSAGFSQGVEFVVLTAAQDRDRFWSCTAAEGPPDTWLQGMRTAPVLVLCLSDPTRYLDRYAESDKGWDEPDTAARLAHWPVPYWDVDAGMAALLLLLGAVDEGLGACFFGVPPERQAAVLAALGAPADRRVVGVVSLGHPAADRRSPSLRRGRRPFGDVVHDGRYGVPFPGPPA